MEGLWEEHERFCERSLDGFQVEYFFLDAVYESMRLERGKKEGIPVAWGITTHAIRVLLHLMLGNKESYEKRLEILWDVVKRGLNIPLLITLDGAPGLERAIDEVWAQEFEAEKFGP